MIIDKERLYSIAVMYLEGENMTDAEKEILLFALYIESSASAGIMREALKRLEKKVKLYE